MQRWPTTIVLLFLLLPGNARGDDAAEQIVLATYKLANDGSTAGGFVVCIDSSDGGEGKCVVVTAHHVLDRMRGNSCSLVSRRRREDKMYQRHEISIPIRKSGNPLWKKHPQHDLAVLPLPNSVKVESIPLDSLATEDLLAEVRVGDSIRSAVFPERVEANNAGLPIMRSGCIASFPLVPVKLHPAFMIDTTSWTGDSGGPIIHQSKRSPSGGPLVIGIVRGMRSVTDTARESRFVERRTHYPLGLSEVMHAALVWDLIPGE